MENNEIGKVYVYESRSKLAAALCSQCQPGKAGAHLRNGLTTESWSLFLAEYAKRAFAKGASVETLATYFVALGAGNMSQVRQAFECLRVNDGTPKGAAFLPLSAQATSLAFTGSDV